MKRNIYLDFEYIERKDKTGYALICASTFDYKNNVIKTFDLRHSYGEFISHICTLMQEPIRFIGYNITTAEVPVMCQIFGREFVLQTEWVDLWTEVKMFTLTHDKYYSKETGLAAAIKLFKIEDKYAADKVRIRGVILFSEQQRRQAEEGRKTRLETNEFYYTDEEYNAIANYCEQDVLILPELAKKLNEVSKKYPITMSHRVNRGQHNKLAGISYYFHRGYPMDVARLEVIFQNIPKIKQSLQLHCNEETQFQIYAPEYRGRGSSKFISHYSFNMKNFIEYVKSKGLYENWEKTKTGLKLDEEYLDEMLSAYKDILQPVKQARDTIKQLNSTNLCELLTPEGYIKSVSWPFNQKTSRTSPKPKLGFILNLTPWLRMLIKPKPGRAFVGIDFKSQEVLIAACLSQDDSMLEDYLTDIYMGQAIKTGFAPSGATKKTHQKFRDLFKPIVLGTQFGMRDEKLSLRFYNLFKESGEEKSMQYCLIQAQKFLKNLEKAYWKYYNYIKKHFKTSKARGYYQSLGDWIYFVDHNTRPTQLVNVPCQSNGAEMTRISHDECVKRGIDALTLHDALYFECAEEDAVRLAKMVSKIMCVASAKVLGFDHMSTETVIYTHETPYYDPRGESVYRFVMKELGLDCPEKFVKPKEITNIHLT